MKKLLSVIISISMLVSVCAAGITAYAEESYGLYVNGSQFTSDNLSITCGEGTAVYEPSTSTLTLTNATMSNASGGGLYGVINSNIPDLTIHLVGENVIDGSSCANDGIGQKALIQRSKDMMAVVAPDKITMDLVTYNDHIILKAEFL